MNLPDYLAPAPDSISEEVERAHDFDFPMRASSPSWADSFQEFSAPCRCGEAIKVEQRLVVLAVSTFEPFRARLHLHREDKAVELRFVAKWGGLDKAPARS